MNKIRENWNIFKEEYTLDEKLVVLLFTSVFMPWWFTLALMVVMAIYVLVKKDGLSLMNEIRGGKILMIFPLYCLITSIFHKNIYGIGISLFLFLMFTLVLYYRKHINSRVFAFMLDVAIVISLISVVYGVFEQFSYMAQIEGMGFLDIQNKPQYRVHTFYYNANYYALMILFVECMCIYKFFVNTDLKCRIYYTLAGVANLFAMYLTGGRVAWLGLAVGVIVMVAVNRWFKMLVAVLVAGAGAVGVLALKPGLIPRLASKGFKIERRKQIWQTAILLIKDHGLFGGGPLAYYNLYESYTDLYIETYGLESYKQYKLGISAPHSHTMFLEPLVSFGVIGTLLMLSYLVGQICNVIRITTKHKDYALAAFIFGCLMVTIFFCILDFPLLWHQTSFLLLAVLGSFGIYKEDVK